MCVDWPAIDWFLLRSLYSVVGRPQCTPAPGHTQNDRRAADPGRRRVGAGQPPPVGNPYSTGGRGRPAGQRPAGGERTVRWPAKGEGAARTPGYTRRTNTKRIIRSEIIGKRNTQTSLQYKQVTTYCTSHRLSSAPHERHTDSPIQCGALTAHRPDRSPSAPRERHTRVSTAHHASSRTVSLSRVSQLGGAPR